MSKSKPVSTAGRPAGEPKEQINPRLPVDMVEQLKALAEANKRTLSSEVEVAVEEHLQRANSETATGRR